MKRLILTASFFAASNHYVDASPEQTPDEVPVLHATGFSIKYADGLKWITVKEPWRGASKPLVYVLYPRDQKRPYVDADLLIPVPVKSCAVLSSTYLPHIDMMGQTDSIIAVDNANYVNTPSIQKGLKEGRIKEVGDIVNVNLERLAALSPEVIFSYTLDNSTEKRRNRLANAGSQTVLAASYLETTPLGRAEWLKFVAAFYDKEGEAVDAFAEIEREYFSLQQKVRHVQEHPTVLSSAPFKGTWHVPGGRSYAAQLIKDAGGTYLWAEDTHSGGVPVALETVFARGMNADIWINPSSWRTLQDGLRQDRRFSAFKSFKGEAVYNNNARLNDNGGNDFWESGVVRPHIVLKDLISIFHPELLPEHTLFYFQQLK